MTFYKVFTHNRPAILHNQGSLNSSEKRTIWYTLQYFYFRSFRALDKLFASNCLQSQGSHVSSL